MMNYADLTTLLEVSINLRESVSKQIDLLGTVIERVETTPPTDKPIKEERQTTMVEHFKRVGKDEEWCMVDPNRPSLNAPVNVTSNEEQTLPRLAEESAPLRRSTRQRHPPKRMEGILVGAALEVELDAHERVTMGTKYKHNKAFYRKLFGQYDCVEDMYVALSDIFEDDCSLLSREEFEDILAILVKWNRSSEVCEEELDQFSVKLFDTLSRYEETCEQYIVNQRDLTVALGLLFVSCEENLEHIYEVYDINEIGYLYSLETLRLNETFYQMIEFLNDNKVKKSLRKNIISDVKKSFNIDLEDAYIKVSYSQLNQMFLGKY